MPIIIDGKAVAQSVRESVKAEVEQLKSKGISTTLAVIIVGDNGASRVYVNNKKKACAEVGIISEEYALPADTTQDELLCLIKMLNDRSDVNGILCQLPVPDHIDESAIINAINPAKDVDAFHRSNVGAIMLGEYNFLPCTPAGIMELIKHYHIDIKGKNCVIIGRSNIVGKPMAMLMLHSDATVTVCHSKTKNLKEVVKSADIVVAAVGRAKFVTADMVKEGAVVIDVGINRDENGKLCGDVDYENVMPLTSYITPVPGGVGPMTIATLMQNTVTASKIANAFFTENK